MKPLGGSDDGDGATGHTLATDTHDGDEALARALEASLRAQDASNPLGGAPQNGAENKSSDDIELALALQASEYGGTTPQHPEMPSAATDNPIRQSWAKRIQNDLLQLSTGSMAIRKHDNGHGFRHRSYRANLESGSCYIWFSIHAMDKKICVMLDASMEVVHSKVVEKHGKQESVFQTEELYPFKPPRVQLVSGRECFPRGSTIRDGDFIEWKWIDNGRLALEWTPTDRICKVVETLTTSLISYYFVEKRAFPPRSHKTFDPFNSGQPVSTRARASSSGGGLFSCCFKSSSAAVDTRHKPVASLVAPAPERVSVASTDPGLASGGSTSKPFPTSPAKAIQEEPQDITNLAVSGGNDCIETSPNFVKRSGEEEEEEEKREIEDPYPH